MKKLKKYINHHKKNLSQYFRQKRISTINNNDVGSLNKIGYRPEIDGLRAFAVVAVIINHFNKELLPSGFLGVDIFFVISGYVITSSLSRGTNKKFKDFILSFFQRRIKRLLPALCFFIFTLSILICLFNPNPSNSLQTGIRGLFGISNFFLFNQSTDYFAQSTELNVFIHTWSLGVEEQFYIIFPFFVWFSGFAKQTKYGLRNLVFIISSLATISLVSFLYLYGKNQPAAYFLMPARFWEIAIGCLIFSCIRKKLFLLKVIERIPPFFLTLIIIFLMFFPIEYASITTLLVVFFTSFLIVSLKKGSTAFQIFTNQKVVYIGLISYSLYLWHWGILSISRWTFGIYWWTIPIQIILILALSIFSYKFIETPFRENKISIKTLTKFVLILIFSLSSILITLEKYLYSFLYLGNSGELYKRNIVKTGINNKHCDFRGERVFKPDYYPNECNFGNKDFDKNDNSERKQNLYFLGSSHAGTLAALIGEISKKINSNIFSLYVGGTFFPALEYDLFPTKEFREFPQKYNISQENIEKFVNSNSNKGDLVVVVNHLELFGKAPSPIPMDNDEMLKIYFKNLNQFTKKMEQKGINVILFGPMPYFVDLVKAGVVDTSNCSKEWFRSNLQNCFFSESRLALLKSNEKLNYLAKDWEIKNSNGFLFEPFKHLCKSNQDTCKNDLEGNIFMFDQDHLNTYGGKILNYPFFEFLLLNNLLKTNPQ